MSKQYLSNFSWVSAWVSKRVNIPPKSAIFSSCFPEIHRFSHEDQNGITALLKQHNPLRHTKKRPSFLMTSLERKTRLELATPTLARLCSTN